MSKKFLVPIDLAKNELLNARIQNLASAPSTPVEGQVYYDTALDQFGVYNGSTWTYLGTAPDLSGYVATTGNQTVAGVKTFTSFPVTPSSAPTTDYQAANKKYVDDTVAGAGGYTDETAQDAIGTILVDSSTVDFTYSDATPSITAAVLDSPLLQGNNGAYYRNTDNHTDGTTNHVFTAADDTKLTGIEALADVTDATNVAAAGAVMDGDFSTSGVMTRTAAGTYTSRTITGTTNLITVTNGDGVSGNPTLTVGSNVYTAGGTDVPITDGGTGVSTLPTGILKGAGTSAITAATAGTDYYAPTGTDVAVTDGGTGRSTSTTAYGIIAAGTTATGAHQTISPGTSGQFLKSAGSAALGAFAAIAESDVTNLVTDLAAKAPLASPTFTGSVTVPTPSAGTDAANKTYVDNAVQGLSWKQAVRVASTANITIASALVNASTVDGVTVATGDRVLLKDQSTPSQNGIYIVAASGAASRATDTDTSAEIDSMTVYVEAGTANADTVWTLTTNDPTLGSTSLAYAQVNGGALPSASTTVEGKVELATDAETNTGTDTTRAITPSNLEAWTGSAQVTQVGTLSSGNATAIVDTATTSAQGKVELATQAEAQAKTDTARAVTPGSLADFARVYTALIGDNASTSIAVTHGLGSQWVTAQVYEASGNAQVECDVVLTSSTQTTFSFAVAPASNALRVVIVG